MPPRSRCSRSPGRRCGTCSAPGRSRPRTPSWCPGWPRCRAWCSASSGCSRRRLETGYAQPGVLTSESTSSSSSPPPRASAHPPSGRPGPPRAGPPATARRGRRPAARSRPRRRRAPAGWCAGRSARTVSRVLRQANELAIWQTAMVAKAVPEARASRAGPGVSPQAQPAWSEDGGEGGHRGHRLGRPEDAEGPPEHGAVDDGVVVASAHDALAGRLGTQRQRREHVGADVEGQDLQHPDREREAAAGQRPHRERRQLGDVVGQVVGEEPADVLERRAAELDRGHDRGEVVVEQHQVGGLACHVAAVRAHGDPHVRLAQGRGVVDAVAGHGDDVARAREHAGDPQLVRRGDPRDHRATGAVQAVRQLARRPRAGTTRRARPRRARADRPRRAIAAARGRMVAGDHRDPDAGVAAGGQGGGDVGVAVGPRARAVPAGGGRAPSARSPVVGPDAAATASTRRPWPAGPPASAARRRGDAGAPGQDTASGAPSTDDPAAAQAELTMRSGL